MTTISILDLVNVTGGQNPQSLVKGSKAPGGGTQVEWRNPANDGKSPLGGPYATPNANGYRAGNGTRGNGGWAIA